MGELSTNEIKFSGKSVGYHIQYLITCIISKFPFRPSSQ